MRRLVIALAVLSLGLLRTITYLWVIKTRALAHETTLLSGRWNVGERGIWVFLVLSALAGIGFVVAGLVLLAGWVDVAVPVFVGTAGFDLLLSILAWPLTVWALIIPWFVFAVALGVAWLAMHVAGWSSR